MVDEIKEFMNAWNLAQAFAAIGAFAALAEYFASQRKDGAKTIKEFIHLNKSNILNVIINSSLFAGLKLAISITQFDGMKLILEIISLGIIGYLSGHLTMLLVEFQKSVIQHVRS